MGIRSYLFPKASIGVYLVAMAVAVALPIFAFVALLMMQLEANEHATLRRETAEDAVALSRTIDRQLRDMATTLNLLATSPELANGDFAGFHARTQATLRSNTLYVIAVDREGQQLLNTRYPYGTVLKTIGDRRSLDDALQTRHTTASAVFRGAMSGKWVYNVTLPIPEGPVAALIITQDAADLERLVTAAGLSPGWSAEVIDQAGQIVAASSDARIAPGTPFDPAVLPLLQGPSGVIEDPKRLPETLLGYAEIPGWPWKAVIWGPLSSAQETILTTWRFLIIGGLALLAVAVLGAYAVALQVRGTIRAIADMARRLGEGEVVSPVETSVLEANTVAVALSNASFDRRQSEDRLHFIMHELVHRSKNMLALVQAMMRQLARRHSDVGEFQAAVTDRLDGLVRSIELLISEEWAGASLRRTVEIHFSAFPQAGEQVTLSGPDMMLKPEAVQNLGLTLHELATNSVKYGGLSTPQGRVSFSWETLPELGESGPQLCFVWQEDGGPAVREPERTGFGTTVIRAHAASAFSGKVDVNYRPEGLRWTLTAPKSAFARKE